MSIHIILDEEGNEYSSEIIYWKTKACIAKHEVHQINTKDLPDASVAIDAKQNASYARLEKDTN